MKYVILLLMLLGASPPLYAAEPQKSLADTLTHDVARLLTLGQLKELADIVKSNEKRMERSSYWPNKQAPDYSQGGKTALHELLTKFPKEEKDSRAFANVRCALITTLFKRLTPEQAHTMIHAKTAVNEATARDIVAFYGSNQNKQYQYVEGEKEVLLGLLAQYDKSAKNIDEKD